MSLQIASPFQQFFDRDGSPLDSGFVYIGAVNLNPETNPLTVYFDDALTIPAAQPLRTSNGYIVRNGSPARLYTSQEDFSLTVREKNGVVVFSVSNATSLSNLGAQFSQFVSDLSDGTGSSLVGYNQGGTGAVDRTVQSRLGDYVSVKDFGAVGDNIADDTAAIQAAIDYATLGIGQTIYIPAGVYLVTDTLYYYEGTKVSGDQMAMYADTNAPVAGDVIPSPINATGTFINFAPTTQKTLFAKSPTIPGLVGGVGFAGLVIIGNSSTSDFWRLLYGVSTPVTTTSLYAFDLPGVAYSTFRNINIRNFMTGIRTNQSQVNTFSNVYVRACRERCVWYDDYDTSTSDVWNNCSFRFTPIGVEAGGVGQSINVRFTDCLFEALDTYGVAVSNRTQVWTFTNCYAEGVPRDGALPGAMFSVGRNNVALGAVTVHIMVFGGRYINQFLGRDKSSFISLKYSYGAYVAGAFPIFYQYIINSDPTTVNWTVSVSGLQHASTYTAFTNDTDKIVGFYDNFGLNNGNIRTKARFRDVQALNFLSDETQTGYLKLTDGVGAPGAQLGLAVLYVDAADGDLKIKFGDGVTKTIATDV